MAATASAHIGVVAAWSRYTAIAALVVSGDQLVGAPGGGGQALGERVPGPGTTGTLGALVMVLTPRPVAVLGEDRGASTSPGRSRGRRRPLVTRSTTGRSRAEADIGAEVGGVVESEEPLRGPSPCCRAGSCWRVVAGVRQALHDEHGRSAAARSGVEVPCPRHSAPDKSATATGLHRQRGASGLVGVVVHESGDRVRRRRTGRRG